MFNLNFYRRKLTKLWRSVGVCILFGKECDLSFVLLVYLTTGWSKSNAYDLYYGEIFV
jgi:hypothetical protein